MHKFIDNIVAFSLKNKFFIFFCTAIAVIAGAVSFKHTPIDAFPDVTNTKVTIITQWPGRSAEEVEKFQYPCVTISTALPGIIKWKFFHENHIPNFVGSYRR